MTSLKKPLAIALTAISMCSAMNLYAQSTAPAAPPPPAPMREKGSMDHAKWEAKMQERMAKQQAELHDKLKITAAQEPAWKTFIDSMKPTMAPGAMPPKPDRKEMDKLSAPAAMEKMLDEMKQHQAMMQTRLDSLKTFYAVLTPEQQKTFDESHRRMMHHWGPGEHGKDGMRRPPMRDGGMPDHPPMPPK